MTLDCKQLLTLVPHYHIEPKSTPETNMHEILDPISEINPKSRIEKSCALEGRNEENGACWKYEITIKS
jgi:hypothetical protein